MKAIGILLLCAGALMAQDDGEKVRVPLRDPSRPATIQAHLISGNINVRGADIKDIEVEVVPHGGRDSHPPPAQDSDGMKRLDVMGNSGLDIVEEENVVTIKVAPWTRPADLDLTVPRHSSLQLKSVNSQGIYVDQVDGEIDVDEVNGKITLDNVSGSVVAHSLNGGVTATIDRIDPSKPMSFSTLNGNIDVTLPQDARANVRLKTDNGAIYSDFEVKLNAQSGMRLNREVRGTINGGGPEYQFTSFNGRIYLRKKK